MADFFLQFGLINKKFIMPFIASILYIIMDIIEYKTEMTELHTVLDLYTRGISYTGIIIIPILQKCCDKNINTEINKCKFTKKTILHYFLLYLNYILYFIAIGYLTKLKSKDPHSTDDFRMSHYTGLCSEESLEIILIIIVSKFLLKNKLYIHHFIGLFIFIIFSLSIDILFKLSLFQPGIYFFFIYTLYLFLDSLFITYEKYMMDKLYYSPYHIVFGIGLLFLACSTCVVILIFIIGDMMYDGKKYKLPKFSSYFEKNNYKDVIIHMIYLTSFRFFLNILKILTIFYFTQNHIYTTYVLIKMFDLLLKKDNKYKYFSLFLFIFQFLGLLIYLEIIELNFLDLNKNTKKNIRTREKTEIEQLDNDCESEGRVSLVEVEPGYLCEINKNENEENNDEKEL